MWPSEDTSGAEYERASTSNTPNLSIRPAIMADSEAIADICLLSTYQSRRVTASTGARRCMRWRTGTGSNAKVEDDRPVFTHHPELAGQVRALPYLHLPSGFCFVLVETREHGSNIGAASARGLKRHIHFDSNSSSTSESDACTITPHINASRARDHDHSYNIVGYVVGTAHSLQFSREVEASWWPILRSRYPANLIGTPLDRYFVDLIHKNTAGIAGVQRVSESTQIHVEVLGRYKSYGCDRLLLDVALRHIRKQRR
jgi:hypothetical protein